jgi:hypothetical protein
LYKEHTEKFINDKADALRDETLAEIRKEWLTLHRTIALLLFAMFLILALAYFWPETAEGLTPEEKNNNGD